MNLSLPTASRFALALCLSLLLFCGGCASHRGSAMVVVKAGGESSINVKGVSPNVSVRNGGPGAVIVTLKDSEEAEGGVERQLESGESFDSPSTAGKFVHVLNISAEDASVRVRFSR